MASSSLDVKMAEAQEVLPTPETKGVEGKNGAFTRDNDVEQGVKYEPEEGVTALVETATDLVTKVIHVEDDPNMTVVTFRVVFLGLGLSIFGSVLQEIFYFKPQTIFVSLIFLTVWAYILGDLMAVLIPTEINWEIGGLRITDGGFLRFLNPGPFNSKEHAAITIMASAASQSALATEALAAQYLFYGGYPSKAAGIFIVLTSQLIGFGVAGLLRDVIVYPTNMIWPMTIPVSSLLETIHRDRKETKRKMRVWYAVFLAIFVWEIFPEYIFTTLIGISIFCLADQHNLFFTNFFGGATGNEGLGVLNISFDWNYIAPFFNPLWYPLQSTVNTLIGIVGCYALFIGLYYGNIWEAKSLPFLSQELFNLTDANSTTYNVYNQSLILNDKFEIEYEKLDAQGIPYLTATYVAYLITTNMGMTATLVYMLLWNWHDLKAAWSWASPSILQKVFSTQGLLFWRNQETPEERLRRKENDPTLDPHYKLILRNKYIEVPLWWWTAVLAVCWAVGLGCLYALESTLPWWGFILATLFTFVFTLFFGAQYGMTGFQFNLQPIFQMLAGYMFPGRPLANFYFTCFTYNATNQAQLLAKDLRLAQYSHLPPRITFVIQIAGCVVGALMNWVMMETIVSAQAPILESIQGTSIWSGQNIQIFNTLAIAWSIAPKMFSIGARYEWVTVVFLLGFLVPIPAYIMYKVTGNRLWGYLNPSIILWFMGNLYVGINSGFTTFFIIAFVFQWYIRKFYPRFFVEWNYLISAAMDGGTQIMIFILTFAVAGGSGTAHPFPTWAGNPDLSKHNTDYCMVNPANQ
ncbi:conserved hypothetical protein [Talaromyces stipitatus ATCC 10500]|uniref:Oligopeptide transporter n=1 Tax=Talaromyces stipitatus (strain ATCC 10500 / CBS 375.48 / QM 6759 / NRRL 1006) TaxID=441959 RepID=B8LXS1_TALSN|nr:uncharacterized protein TSTA_080110 [Talaromyces stipitatus ATCC 10500]EED24656.1 conserved hypothetical protein [Talaromyces stipitatus ATCC 10500]